MEKKSVLMDQMKKQLVSEYFFWIGSLMDLSAYPFFCKLLGLVVNKQGLMKTDILNIKALGSF